MINIKILLRKRLLENDNNKIVVYHGSNYKFDKFELLDDTIPKAFGSLKGFYFAKNKEDAYEYGNIIYTIELTYTKVLKGNPFNHLEKILNVKPITWSAKSSDYAEYKSKVNKESVMDYINQNGYDLIYIPSNESAAGIDEYIVFNPSQIKILNIKKLLRENFIPEVLKLKNWDEYLKIVAKAYNEAPDYDASVVHHWDSLNASNHTLFKRLLSKIKIIFTTNDKSKVGSMDIMGKTYPIEYLNGEPYSAQSQMKNDVIKNNTIRISIDYSDHKIFSLQDNVIFRTVHDYIVHILGDKQFGAKGEIASYNLHAKLVPKDAVPAIFTEVVGQASIAITSGSFPSKQKIAVLKGFDYYNVGEVDDYEINNKELVKKDEEKVFEEIMDEDYPSSFDMEHFKSLRKYAERVKYCDQHLKKISSGSARIVYIIDNEKVLKLAKNEKGVAQCEVEIQWGNDSYFGGILARTIDSHPDGLWVEMELARKVKKGDFKTLAGFNFDDLNTYLRNAEQQMKGRRPMFSIDPEVKETMEQNEFVTELVNLMNSMDAPAGDMTRLNSYGIVKRNGHDTIVLIDFGLTNQVYSDYYDRYK
jgi:ADP-Ribosyltransferase in polyvalent proteins